MSESENRGPVRPGNQKPFDLPGRPGSGRWGACAFVCGSILPFFSGEPNPVSPTPNSGHLKTPPAKALRAKHPKRPTNRCRKTPKPLLNPILRRRKLNVWKRNVWLKKKLEQEKLEQQRLEQKRLEQERLAEQKRLEEERLEQQRLEQERLEQERLAEQKQLEEERAAEEARRARRLVWRKNAA